MDTIRIGEPLDQITPRLTRPLTYLPNRLDQATCLQLLAQIAPEAKTDSVSAARRSVDVDHVDDALEYTSLSLSDKMRFKQALSAHGILSLGKRV